MSGPQKEEVKQDLKEEKDKSSKKDIKSYSIKELNEILEKAIEAEEYEKASEIRDEINRRKSN